MASHPILIRALAASIALSLTLHVVGARAAEDLERARETFRDALVLEVAGDWAAALAKFQDVAKARLTPQVRYHLARCKENLGRMTEALGDYRVAEAEARLAGLEETPEMERARRDLETRVPRIKLRFSGLRTAVVVEFDGIALGATALNQPMVVDPGWHRITLRSGTGFITDSFVVATVGKLTEVDLREHERSTLAQPIPVMVPASGLPQSPPTWVYVSAGIGTAAIATSAVLWVVRNRAEQELEDNCRGRICPESLKGVEERGKVASVLSPIALGMGIAGLGMAAWGFWSHASNAGSNRTSLSRPPPNRSVVSAGVAPGAWGVHFGAEF